MSTVVILLKRFWSSIRNIRNLSSIPSQVIHFSLQFRCCRVIQSSVFLIIRNDWFYRCHLFRINSLKLVFFFLKVPSSAVSCFHDGKQYLYLACRDGFVRIYDCQYKALILPVIEGPKRKALVCMKVSKDKVMTCFCSITRLSLIETRHKFNWNRYFIRSNESSWWDWFNSLNYST